MLTYHLALREEFEAAKETYAPSAFAHEGFIHTTRRREILHEVANRYYQNERREHLVLTIDLEKSPAPWRYDLPNDEYPHIYGPIPLAAIIHTEPISRSADGRFLPL